MILDPLVLSIILGFLLMISLILINYFRDRKFDIRNIFEIIISSFLSASAIVYSILGAIHYGFYNQIYPGLDESFFRTIVTIGGVVTLAATFYWISGLIIRTPKKGKKS